MKHLLLTIITVVIVQGSWGQEESGSGRPRQIENRFAVKFTPTQLIMGELNLGAEFKIDRKSSLDIELGPTISYTGIGGRTEMDFEDDDNGLIKEGGIGYFGALGFRYYPFDKTQALTRLYVQPQFKYRVYNSTISEETGLWSSVQSENTQYKVFFNVGWMLWASKSFGFDFYLGAGMGYRSVDRYSPTITYGNSISYDWIETEYNKTQLLLNFGIKMGIGG